MSEGVKTRIINNHINRNMLIVIMDMLHDIDYSVFQGQMMDEIGVMMENMVQTEIYNSDTYRKYKLYECIYVDHVPVQVTTKMASEIDWLIHYVKETHLYLYEDYRDDMLEKFDRVTNYLPKLFDLYNTYIDDDYYRDKYTFEPSETLRSIKQILTPFRDCVNRDGFDTGYVEFCVKLLEYCKFNANFMRNRLDELEFDLEYMKTHPEYIAGH